MESDLNLQLINSARAGNLPLVQELIERGADINFRDSAGQSALHVSLWWKRREVLDRLLTRGADLNVVDRDGKTVLMRAVIQGDLLLVEELLNRGAPIDAVDSRYGRTALMQASIYDKAEVLALLLSRGANPDIQDYGGDTAEGLAGKWGKRGVVEAFLSFQQSSEERCIQPEKEIQSEGRLIHSQASAIIDSEGTSTEPAREPLAGINPPIGAANANHSTNFQASSSAQGDAFAQMCIAHLRAQGFDLKGRLLVREAGVEIDQIAMNRCKIPIYFEFKGSTIGNRPGMIRTDTTKKAIANAFLLDKIGVRPFVVLTTNKPRKGSASDAMIKTAGGKVLEVLCLFDSDDKERLEWYLEASDFGPSLATQASNNNDSAYKEGGGISANADLTDPVLIMIDSRGGSFDESDSWDEITAFLDWGATNIFDSESNISIKDKFYSTLDSLCERGFLERTNLRRIFHPLVITEKGQDYLRQSMFI